MCLVSVGMDLVDVGEFADLLAQPGSDFAARVFGAAELTVAAELPGSRRTQHLAARFAAKEAFVKAWSGALADGAPLLPETQTWAGIAVRTDTYGRPRIELAEPVAGAVSRSLGDVRTSVSLSHESSVASAVVVLSHSQAGHDPATGASPR
jgi:holo-[acyl-carrier protein] synthase